MLKEQKYSIYTVWKNGESIIYNVHTLQNIIDFCVKFITIG